MHAVLPACRRNGVRVISNMGAANPLGGARAGRESPTTAMPRSASSPRIFRGDDSATRQMPAQKPRIFRPPDST